MKAYPDTNIFIFGITDPVSESATILECAGMLVVLLAGATWAVDDAGGADFTSVRARRWIWRAPGIRLRRGATHADQWCGIN
jgi:hypothetical protein